MTYSGMILLKRSFAQALRKSSGHLTKLLGVGALVVIGATALVTVIFAPGRFGYHGSDIQASQFKPSQKFKNTALTIFVPSTIYAEASEPLPFFVEIDPRQLVPPDSVLSIHGLPPAASLSEGHRVSADEWVVPIVGLSNLEIHVTAGVLQRSDLTLTLIRADGGLLAKAHTVLSIVEPIGTSTTVTAVKNTKAEEEREAAEAAKKAEEARRLAEAKAAEDARRAEAARKAAEAKRQVSQPSVSESPPGASVKPEPKLAAIPDRSTAAAEGTASAAPLSGDRERLAKMITRGERELEAGNVSIARQFFLRAAEGGLARGALLLAWTYDKDEFAKLRIQGVTPNRELADKWYKRARELEAADKTGAR